MERLVLFRPGPRGAARARLLISTLLVAAGAAHFVLGSYLSVDLFIFPILIACVVFRLRGLVVLPMAALGYAAASCLSGDLPFRFIFLNSLGQLIEWTLLAVFVLVTLDRYGVVKQLESRIKGDLELARRLQSALIQPAYDFGTVSIRGFVQQSNDVGGDFYYFRPFLQKYVVFCLGDVMGKGISASLLMAMVMGFMFEWGKKSTSPRFILRKLNSRLLRQWGASEHAFLTTFYAVYAEDTRELTYSAAGHHGALLVRGTGELLSLGTEGIPLGVFEDSDFEDATVKLEVGDRVIVFTDGVTEARGQDGELFGVERLERIVLSHRHVDTSRLLSAIEAGVKQHSRGRLTDDTAVMVMEVKAPDAAFPEENA
jgi:sigma-B regulation protein RsbU (phosphoserine phosphatase)